MAILDENYVAKKYYKYDRQSGWIDYGYPDVHTVPHWHEVVYDSTYPNGLIIDHRTSTAIPR